MRTVCVFYLLILLVCVHAQSTASFFGKRTRGEATFYGAGADKGGTCMLNNPTHNLGLPTVAIGGYTSEKCGMCVMIYPSGSGSGNSDFPRRKPFMAYVNNKCPECPATNLDLAQSSDGRWNLEWEAVDCPVSGNIQLQLKSGSSVWHTEISARNFRVPISRMEFQIDGQWQALRRQEYNYFVLSGSINGKLPVNVRMTSINGESVQTTLDSNAYSRIEPALIDSGRQFRGRGGNPSTPNPNPNPRPAPNPNPRPAPRPSPSPSTGGACASVAHALDPQNLFWVEVSGAPASANLKLKCAGRSDEISCKFAFGVKWQCNPGRACNHPRTVTVSGRTCALPANRFKAAAVASDPTILTTQSTNYNNDSGMPGYVWAIIVVATIAQLGVLIFMYSSRPRQ